MQAHRSELEYYGDTYGDWAPYRPHLAQPLGSFASAIAARRQFRAEVADIGELPDRAERARLHNQLLVLLVDAWATRLSDHGSALARHDADSSATTAVMIPLNRHAVALRAQFDARGHSRSARCSGGRCRLLAGPRVGDADVGVAGTPGSRTRFGWTDADRSSGNRTQETTTLDSSSSRGGTGEVPRSLSRNRCHGAHQPPRRASGIQAG